MWFLVGCCEAHTVTYTLSHTATHTPSYIHMLIHPHPLTGITPLFIDKSTQSVAQTFKTLYIHTVLYPGPEGDVFVCVCDSL